MFGLLQPFRGASPTKRALVRRYSRCMGISLLLAALAGVAVVPFFARGQGDGEHGSVFNVENESGQAGPSTWPASRSWPPKTHSFSTSAT